MELVPQKERGIGGVVGEYKPEFAPELITHMGEGRSFESFAGKKGVCRATLYNWLAHQEFLDAKQAGEAASLTWWEDAGIRGLFDRNFKDRHWAFNMTVRHGYAGFDPALGLGNIKPFESKRQQGSIDAKVLPKETMISEIKALTTGERE